MAISEMQLSDLEERMADLDSEEGDNFDSKNAKPKNKVGNLVSKKDGRELRMKRRSDEEEEDYVNL